MVRCVLGFAVLNVMNAVICLDCCHYDEHSTTLFAKNVVVSLIETAYVQRLAATAL